jgi:hydrogenase small subunit
MKWNGRTSWPVDSGHPCIGCAEKGFWDNGPLYRQLAGVRTGRHDHDERELVHAGER